MPKQHDSILSGCVALDLEVGRHDSVIHAFGAVYASDGRTLTHSGGALDAALERLDAFAEGASFVLGHNLIAFDLPHLKAAKPELRLLRLPAVDTLRLSPLAFPRNPYHHLVKHYQDGGLRRRQLNDPELDARLALEVFGDQREALAKAEPDLLASWHWLITPEPEGEDRAVDALFSEIRGTHRPADAEARAVIRARLEGAGCAVQAQAMVAAARTGWALAYALAWLSVAGGNSVMPPWVRHQFPEAGRLVRRLRDMACTDPACGWCREHHDPRRELKRWFRFDDFRPEPLDAEGQPMQRTIVEAAMTGRHVLGILPTGTGKSLCYQIPALSRYQKTGALTVVISPLVALMADQVAGLEARGIGCCVAVTGLLSMPERADALDRVRLGDAGILLISPEQLRAPSLRRALDQREIGAWVLDEAHCLSRWGHDFRPDYLYVSRFIRDKATAGKPPPVLCLTATAKPDVVEDITRHFRDRLGIELMVVNGGVERSNLTFEVMPTSGGEKFADIHQVLTQYLAPQQPGGAIIYCATRRQAEEVAEFLQLKGVAADLFHAKLPPETKKSVQQRFIAGELRAIAATNAFGMGIDKPDVRLVIHADIPGSLENYLQEAGRAGRDLASARCVLLYAADDVERQFGMSARSRLTREEIHGILRALHRLDRKKRLGGEVVATTAEILGEDEDQAFERDSATDDTRVRVAVAWLEEAALLTREENRVQVFPSSLRVQSAEEIRERLRNAPMTQAYRRQLELVAGALINARPDEGLSTDDLMGVSGLSPEAVRHALYDLERLGIASNDTALTAFVHAGVERSSLKRLEAATQLETGLIRHMREAAPDLGKGDTSSLHLRIAAQVLRDEGAPDPLPERLWRIIRGIAYDGRGEDGAAGSLTARKLDAETGRVTLHREWDALEETARIRREGAKRLLEHLLDYLPSGTRGTDLLAETTLGKLTHALESDLEIKSRIRYPARLLDRALLWLHELEVIRLNKGLTVFRPAMTIRLRQDRRGFAKADFAPLAIHYRGQILQIHVMVEFAQRGLQAVTEATRLAMEYFTLKEEEFLRRWLPDRGRELERETTAASWRAIVESLGNPVQQRIVADDREQTNVLVLAGPGSGKTRVLVHRIAYLIRARRENARGILALAYNRHAAVDIRRRLVELIGDDARGVTVLTCHALAMRLAGASFTGREGQPDDAVFREILQQAVELLRGQGLPPEEADEQRARLLAGFRWILVDEYQDIAADQYELISALAGRAIQDEAGKLTVFAVGDDDQNIYAFNGTSVEYIRRFQDDYGPRPVHLVENYRSTAHIIDAANAVIEPAGERMKAEHPIRVNAARAKDAPGGAWQELDSVGRGRVQVLPTPRDPVAQASAVMTELLRLSDLSPDWDWTRCAVIARKWEYLAPVRAFCEAHDITAQIGNEGIPGFWWLRETRDFVEWLRSRDTGLVDAPALRTWAEEHLSGPWHELLRQGIDEHALETGGGETPVAHFIEWLAEWGREIRRRQRGLLLLTAHRAKGLEFDHVAVLDGGWEHVGRDEDPDAPRRLYYVAMTRARETLALARFEGGHPFQDALLAHPSALRREPPTLPPCPPELRYRYVQPSLREVDLGFAGRRQPDHPTHRAISALSVGDPLTTRVLEGGRWELLDGNGTVVGPLAASFEPPAGMRCRSAKVFAIVARSREWSDPKYHDSIRCDPWEVVVPELVFEPAEA
ncbi:MAG: RecQ family ATP-dependent DNA helicase [Deltaproteobacteria bacterium]|nr:RecQ family ATP-dependent DNA helicase [Deltaproteobacteria bacterium]